MKSFTFARERRPLQERWRISGDRFRDKTTTTTTQDRGNCNKKSRNNSSAKSSARMCGRNKPVWAEGGRHHMLGGTTRSSTPSGVARRLQDIGSPPSLGYPPERSNNDSFPPPPPRNINNSSSNVPFKKRKRFPAEDFGTGSNQRRRYNNSSPKNLKSGFASSLQSHPDKKYSELATVKNPISSLEAHFRGRTSPSEFFKHGKEHATTTSSFAGISPLDHSGSAAAATYTSMAGKFSARSFDEDNKSAVVSDSQTHDIHDNSTASTCSISVDNASTMLPSSSVHKLSPLVTADKKPMDIPRQIETPTNHLIEDSLNTKIPKKSKLSVVRGAEQQKQCLDDTPPNVSSPTVAAVADVTTTDSSTPKASNVLVLGDDATVKKMGKPSSKLKILITRIPEKIEEAKMSKTITEESREEVSVTELQTPGEKSPVKKRPPRSEVSPVHATETPIDSQPSAESFERPTASVSKTTPKEEENDNSKESFVQLPSSKDAGKREYNLLQIGARVAVYWDGEDEFYDATVTKERPHKKKRYFLEYDDGDREWVNLRKERWRLLGGGREEVSEIPKSKKANKESKVSKEPKTTLRKEIVHTKSVQVKTEKPRKTPSAFDVADWINDDEWVLKAARKSESDSETDDEEIIQHASKMFGVDKSAIARQKKEEKSESRVQKKQETRVDRNIKKQELPVVPQWEPRWEDFGDVHIPISEKVKFGRRRSRVEAPADSEVKREKKKRKKMLKYGALASNKGTSVEARPWKSVSDCRDVKPSNEVNAECDVLAALVDDEDEVSRRKKAEARTPTAEEIRAILGEDDPCGTSTHWVRRSARMPSMSVVNGRRFKMLLDKLRTNDPDMVVLKMKKYLSDPDCPQVCIDTVLDALEENTNCQSLYIQNFNEGMRDKQVLRLLQILKKPSCNIWCLNIGETYKVKTRTWKAFTRGLKDTKITHMYASEHTISSELKDRIRATIRENRKKHSMHIDPENLDVIVKCTHCWWNPINAKVLRPHLHRKGYAHILNDSEALGLPGTNSGAVLT